MTVCASVFFIVSSFYFYVMYGILSYPIHIATLNLYFYTHTLVARIVVLP
jgi:hypothetical protein